MNLLSNAKWNTFSQLFKILVQVINLTYLVKIIAPSEYGIMAMAMVVSNLGFLLRDLGTSAAIIQRKEINNNLLNTVFWLNLVMGIAICFVISASSPLISNFYGQPKLVSVLILLSFTFPLSSCAATHLALLERKSRFKEISKIEILSAGLSLIVAIFFASRGFGVYSLVAQAIVVNLCSAIQFWIVSDWRPSFNNFFDKLEFKKIFGFTANLSFFNVINYLSRNADSFIIGKFMSASILGAYSLAYRVMLFPLQSITFVASRSLYPILSKLQDDVDEFKSLYFKCVFFILMITMPLMSGLAYYSQPFVLLIFGKKWGLTSSILQILAPTAIIQSVLSTTGSVFMARGRADVLMKLGVIGAILQVGGFIIGVNYSIQIFSAIYLFANILNFLPVFYCLLKILNGTFSEFFKTISPIIFSTILILVTIMVISNFFPLIQSVTSLYELIALSIFCAFVYFSSLITLSSFFRNICIKKWHSLKN